MKVVEPKKWKVNGEVRWVFDGKINGKRKREQFDTKKACELFIKAQTKEPLIAAWWSELTVSERVDIHASHNRAKEDGFSLLSAVEAYGVNGRGKSFLKKCTLGEAVGTSGPDKRHKNHDKQPKASGFIGAKARMGVQKHSLSTCKSQITDFRDYIGADTQVANITPEMIESWIDEGGVRGKEWKSTTKRSNLARVRGFFAWCMRKDYVSSNSALKLENFIITNYEPVILKLDQVVQFLEITKKHDPALLTPAALNLFCGIRPSEVRRMTQGNISFADREVELKSRQTKTRHRRFVDISDNCIEWLKIGGKMPLANMNHRWHALIIKAKAELGFEKWPHDCLRHSFCSYYLAAHENAAKTALQAGHTETILFKHYRKLVKKEQAEKFWNIFPEELAA
jgi:site-specific recombinase XerD